jgi:ribosomal-protein-alanine N-acetyltransferase
MVKKTSHGQARHMSIHIHLTGSASAALLAELHAKAFPANQAWDMATFSQFLALPGHFALILTEADAPMGFVLGRTAPPEAEILTFAITPEVRRKGMGWTLLQALLHEAAARGATEVFLEVAESNAAARALYAKAGAQEVGRRQRYYADGAHALVLRMALEP